VTHRPWMRLAPLLPLLLLACSEEPAEREPGSDLGPAVADGLPAVDGQLGFADGAATAADQGAVDDAATPQPDSAPPPAPTFSFVVFGDNQFATTSCTSGVPERLAVPEVVLDLKPDFVVHTGDLMDHGYESGAYAKFVSCYSGMLAKHPFFPTMGNHDAGSGGVLKYKSFLENQLTTRNAKAWGSGYKSAFNVSYNDDPTNYSTSFSSPNYNQSVPSGVSFKTFYAYRHKNAYFISFEQGTRWWTNTPTTWVEKHLKKAHADPSIDHIFVHMHHPMYSTTMAESSSSGECIQPVRKVYEALFRKYDVTMVFSGHAHLYDRFYVPDDGSKTRQDPPPTSYPHDGSAIHYIVTGGGGGGLNSCGLKQEKSYDYFQSRACVFHVTRVQVKGKQLTVSVVKVTGSASSYTKKVIDTFAVGAP
jgi:hypothetical protein